MEDQRRGAGRKGGLRPPPGFENLAGDRQGTGAEEDSATAPSSSSSARGAIHGTFPFPPPRDSPQSPASSSSSSASSSTCPEVASEYSERGKMESTNAWLFSHHHEQLVVNLKRKYQDLLDYDKTKNQKILHLDWVAGNPEDPVHEDDKVAPSSGMTQEDRRLSTMVTRMTMKNGHGVNPWDERETWNKAMLFGDWLCDHKGVRQFFIEIQVKRISGEKDTLLEQCGVSPELAWLSLFNEKAPTVQPIILPPIPTPQAARSQTPRELPTPRPPVHETIPEVEEEEIATSAPASSADKGKDKAVDPPAAADDGNSTHPRSGVDISRGDIVVSSSSVAQSSKQRTPLPTTNPFHAQTVAPDTNRPSAGPSEVRASIPRSDPLPNTGSYDSLNETANSEQSDTTHESFYHDEVTYQDEPSYQDEGTVYLGEDEDPFANLGGAHQMTALSAAELHARRQDFHRDAAAKRDELNNMIAFHQDPTFIARKKKSFIYAVRIIAVPDRGDVVNQFTGPPVRNRYGTLLGTGGWVVPPLEERIKWRDEHKRFYRNKCAKPGKYEGLPYPQVQNAMPLRFDWSGQLTPRYFGPAAPLWREMCDPTLEDVYWMAWQLVGGKQYLGFRAGHGFGADRRLCEGDQALLKECPFKSPSVESLYHAASYGEEANKKK
ncbi:hypothetical protein N0V88_005598 [Collariella sp. IMI 366227]|nr:hypothetical protein N0V88_005598 [Collariella sp. IMI 366227]